MNGLFTLSAYTQKMHATGWLMPIGLTFGAIIGFIFGTETMCLIFVGALVLDFITGIMASVKRGEAIESSRVRDMFYKWAAYLFVLIVAAGLDICIASVWIHTAALGWIILSEGVSILENCEQIIGKRIPFLGKLKKTLDALKGGSNGTNSKTYYNK